MSIHKSYAVFGLGKYGASVATELVENGLEVLAVDSDMNIVNEMSEFIPLCKCADVTEKETLKALGISNFDVVIIAMADSFEATVMATTLCKEAGVENVIVKCASRMHEKILLRVGADRVVIPEHESGVRLAKNLASSGFVDAVELTKNVSMVEMDVRSDWEGKNLIELNLRKKYSINVIAIKEGDNISLDFAPETKLHAGMKLVIVADTAKLEKLGI